MLQNIEGKLLFIVDFDVLPELPITDGGVPYFAPYAQALNDAILTKVITKPGKYGIELQYPAYFIHTIIE